MNRTLRILAVTAALLVGSACSNDPTGGSSAGKLIVRLTTPNQDDGAVLFQVSGGPIDTAIAMGSLRLFTRRMNDSTIVAALVGTLSGGDVVTLQVSDLGARAGYAVRVLEVANRQDALRASLTGYALTVDPLR